MIRVVDEWCYECLMNQAATMFTYSHTKKSTGIADLRLNGKRLGIKGYQYVMRYFDYVLSQPRYYNSFFLFLYEPQ